jgi:1,4-dihydroxy-2-naphthoate octaprenyltransferase
MNLSIWIKQLRAPGFTLAGSICIPLGTAIAWYEYGVFDASLFILTWIAFALILEGCFLTNEYYDYRTGCDLNVASRDVTPFSGGSRVLPERLLEPKVVLKISYLLHLLGCSLGFYLAIKRSLFILPLGLLGFFFSYFYTAPPLRLSSRGLGEIITGINCGLLSTLGSYLVQTGRFSWLPFFASLTPSILLGTLLWVNEIPDVDADSSAGKLTMVARIGRRKAALTYPVLLAIAYLLLLIEVGLHLLPMPSLIALLTIPLAFHAVLTIVRNHSDSKKLIPGLLSNILITLTAISIITISFLSPTLYSLSF